MAWLGGLETIYNNNGCVRTCLLSIQHRVKCLREKPGVNGCSICDTKKLKGKKTTTKMGRKIKNVASAVLRIWLPVGTVPAGTAGEICQRCDVTQNNSTQHGRMGVGRLRAMCVTGVELAWCGLELEQEKIRNHNTVGLAMENTITTR